jgi:tRNA/tmRNA/rRNA uracil-C5-methylase (TrmA/RlmC/RlmD family)
MTASKSLPARPSIESLRKEAKRLARDFAAGNGDSITRVRKHLPHVEALTTRNAQVVVAREYGYPGWQDLTAEVNKRLGSLDWAAAETQLAENTRIEFAGSTTCADWANPCIGGPVATTRPWLPNAMGLGKFS